MELPKSELWSSNDLDLFLLGSDDVTDDYVNWLSDPEVNCYLESRFATHTNASVRDYVSHCRRDPNTVFFGIRAPELDNTYVGNIKLAPIDPRHGLAEVGILIGDRAAWGKGIATRAIRSVSAIAQQELGLRKLTAGCYASNVGSKIAFQRAGFEVEGTRPDHFILDDKPEALILMAKLL